VSLQDEPSIKKAILSRAESKLSPKELDEQYRQIAVNREMLSNIKRFEQAGATVTYHSVDVRNAGDVQRIIASVGQVSGLIHGAGVLADRFIEDKTREQFDRVYSTKVAGAMNILGALSEHDLHFIAMFSSSTARFGRKGQVDYAMANEVLNKLAQREARSRTGGTGGTDCRVVSANWGPWDGGMVTPALAKVFEAEGIDVIPLEAGAQYLLQELSQPAQDAPVEVVILGGQSKVVEVEKTTLQATIDMQIDLERHSYLRSHVIDGKAVLPAAMITEYLAHGAMHEHPGLVLAGIDDLRILKGVILENGQANLRIVTGEMAMDNGIFAVPVELVGSFVHARARVLLADRVSEGEPRLADQTFAPAALDRDSLYTPQMLFHGHDMQGIAAVYGCDENGIAVDYQAAPAPSAWIQPPLRSSWIADPLAIDCAFQMMIIWSRLQRGIGSLPTFAGRYRQFQQSYPKGGGRIIAKVTDQGDHYVRADFEFLDHEGKLIAQIENCECVIDQSLNSAFERNTLEAQAVS
jgi:NAD(P)-dependent dehydrogenase (short-subunit alcohol dehydrogenase family)